MSVLEGLIGFVVMDRSIVLMVMMDALIMLELVDQRRRAGNGRQAALHGKAIQGQAKQQEDGENPAQKNHQVNFARL